MSATILKRDAVFKNVAGKLSLTATHIAWVPDVPGTMDRQQQNLNRITNLMASKEGKPRVSLKLVFKDDLPAGGLLFTFTTPNKLELRQEVQDALIPHVTANKIAAASGPATPSAPGPSVVQPSTATAAVVSQVGASSTDVTPNAAKRRKLDVAPGLADTPGAGPSTPGTPTVMTPEQQAARKLENKLKMNVLKKNPNLWALHKELVRGQQISEKEFWEGREALLDAERLTHSLKPGRPSRLLDDRFDLDPSRSKNSSSGGGTGVGVKQKESGPMVLNITKELTREIFEEFPVVQDAYARHVPGISEAEFWTRYFTSQLWEQHRASVRKATNEDVNRKKDDIFDLYLEDPDWGVEPRKEVGELVGRVIDLAATEQDHGDSDTVRDHTMQAGRERSSLPLIRRFNEHSNKLLRRSGGDKSTLSSSFLPDDANIYDEIDLEDLHGPAQENTIALDVRDADADDGTRNGGAVKGILPGRSDEELLALANTHSTEIADWNLDFTGISLVNPLMTTSATGALEHRDYAAVDDETKRAYEKFNLQRSAQKVAMSTVRDMHIAAGAENMVYPELPAELLDSMRTCHNAATEFLRQYWSAVLPTPVAALGAGTASTSESAKAAKAERMAGYLKGMEGKLEAVVHLGVSMGVDQGRVRAALAPTFGAVAVGLQKEERRLAGIKAKQNGAGAKKIANGRA